MVTPHKLVLDGVARLIRGPHSDRALEDAEELVLQVFQKDKAWLLAYWEDEFPDDHTLHYLELVERRYNGEPLQYIAGQTEFYGLPFFVTPDVLIPRPETEHLVEKVIELAASLQSTRIVDIGAGSGAIAVALAHALKGHDFSRAAEAQKTSGALAPEGRSSTTITAIDFSAPALAIARKNAARNKATIRFLQGDLLTPVANEKFEIVVSNPPYVPEPDRPTLSVEVRDHEPALALFAGPDGLDIYRRLIPQAFACLVPGGFLVLEIGYNQSPAIADHLAANGFQNIEFLPDLQQIPRVAVARRP